MESIKLNNIPLYIQIAESIKTKIDDGFYSKDQLLPSEAEIQNIYGVSRITTRKAYKLLIDKGIIHCVRGKGTYINDLKEKDWTWMKHFTTEVKNQGGEPSSKIVKFKRMTIPPEICEMLDADKDDEIFYIVRIRSIDNFPVWLTKSYVLTSIAEELTNEYFSVKGVAQSLFYVLEKDFGIDFSRGVEVDYIGEAEESDLKLLESDFYDKTNNIYTKNAYLLKDIKQKAIIYEKSIIKKIVTK